MKIELCAALRHIETDLSRELLLQLTQDVDFDVRKSAILALGTFHKSKQTLVPILEPFLQDDHWSVREAAITALGTLQATEAEDQLLDMLNDPDLAVRRALFIALGHLCSLRAIPFLIEHLAHEDLDYAAYQALTLIAIHQREHIAAYADHENPKIYLFFQHILERT